MFGGPRAPGAAAALGLELQDARDAEEDELLSGLEELAQKTEVLTHWADEMYNYVKEFPQSKVFLRVAIVLILKHSVAPEPLPDPMKFLRREGETEKLAARRKNVDIQAEYNAVTCVAVYMLLMTFSQKGIDRLREHLDTMQARDPDGEYEISEGFDEGALTDVPRDREFSDQPLSFHQL